MSCIWVSRQNSIHIRGIVKRTVSNGVQRCPHDVGATTELGAVGAGLDESRKKIIRQVIRRLAGHSDRCGPRKSIGTLLLLT